MKGIGVTHHFGWFSSWYTGLKSRASNTKSTKVDWGGFKSGKSMSPVGFSRLRSDSTGLESGASVAEFPLNASVWRRSSKVFMLDQPRLLMRITRLSMMRFARRSGQRAVERQRAQGFPGARVLLRQSGCLGSDPTLHNLNSTVAGGRVVGVTVAQLGEKERGGRGVADDYHTRA